MSVKLTNNFFQNARGLTLTGDGGVTCSLNPNTNQLTIDGTAAGSAGANPTAVVGLTAVNGSADTFLRSDGAPALSQAIAPTWTGNHVFNPASGAPLLVKLNGTAVFSVPGVSAPTVQGYGPIAAALVDMTPDQGVFTATLTGCTTSPTGQATWARVGNLVVLCLPIVTGTSSANTFTLTGLPASIQPTRGQRIVVPDFAIENGGTAGGITTDAELAVAAGSGTIFFYNGGSSTGWTASGAKGIAVVFTVSYLLN